MKKFFFTLMTCSVLVSFTYCVHLKNVFRLSKQASVDESCDKGNGHQSGIPTMSAILMECPKRKTRTSDVINCEQKVLVNVRVAPSEKVEEFEKYLLVDELYDPKKKSRAKLMEPYLIEVTRGEPVLMYPLEIVKSLQCASCNKNHDNSDKMKKDLSSMNDYEEDDDITNLNDDNGNEDNDNHHHELIDRLHENSPLKHQNHIVRRDNDYSDDENLYFDKSAYENIFEELDNKENDIKTDIANYMQSKLIDDNLNEASEFDNGFNDNKENSHDASVFLKDNHNSDIDPYCFCPCSQCTGLQGENKCDCCGTCICSNGVCDVQGTHKEQGFFKDIGEKEKYNDNYDSDIFSNEPLEKDIFNFDSIINDYDSNKMLRESNEEFFRNQNNDFSNLKADHIQQMSDNNQYIAEDNSNAQANYPKPNTQFSGSDASVAQLLTSKNAYNVPDHYEQSNNINSDFDYRSNDMLFDYDIQNMDGRPLVHMERDEHKQLQQPIYGNIMDSNFRQNVQSELSAFNKNNNNNNNNAQYSNNVGDYGRANNRNTGYGQDGTETEPQNIYEYVKRRNEMIYGMGNENQNQNQKQNQNQNQNIKTSHQTDNNEIVPMNSDRIDANDEYDAGNMYHTNGGTVYNRPNSDMRYNPPSSNYNFHINFEQPKLEGSNMDKSQQENLHANNKNNIKSQTSGNNYKSMEQPQTFHEKYKTYDNSLNQDQRKINNNNQQQQRGYTNNVGNSGENLNNVVSIKRNRQLQTPVSTSQTSQNQNQNQEHKVINDNQSLNYQQQSEQMKENQQKQQSTQQQQQQPQVPIKQQQEVQNQTPNQQSVPNHPEHQQATECICSSGLCQCNGQSQPIEYHQNNDLKNGPRPIGNNNNNNNGANHQQILNVPATDNNIPTTSKLLTAHKDTEQIPNQILNENQNQNNKISNGLLDNMNVNNQQIPSNLKHANTENQQMNNNFNSVNNRFEDSLKTTAKNDFITNENNNNNYNTNNNNNNHVIPVSQQQQQQQHTQQQQKYNDGRFNSQANNANSLNSNTNHNYNYNNNNNNNNVNKNKEYNVGNENFRNNDKSNVNSGMMNNQYNQHNNPDTKNKFSTSKGFPQMEVSKTNNNNNNNGNGNKIYNDFNENRDNNDDNSINLKEDNDDSSASDIDDYETDEDELSDWPEVLSPKKLPNAWPEVYRKARNNINNNNNNNYKNQNQMKIRKSNKIKKNISNNGIKGLRDKQSKINEELEEKLKKIQEEKFVFPSNDILNDRNLNTNDKMHLIDLLDNQRVNKELTDLERVYDLSIEQNNKRIPENLLPNHFYKRKVKQQPQQQQKLYQERQLSSKNIAKRSYIFYDDLTFADTDRENDWENRFNELSPKFVDSTNDEGYDAGGDDDVLGDDQTLIELYEPSDNNINVQKKEILSKKSQTNKIKNLNNKIENIVVQQQQQSQQPKQQVQQHQEIGKKSIGDEETDELFNMPASDNNIVENNPAPLQNTNNNNNIANNDKKTSGKLQNNKTRRKMDDVWYTVYNMSAPLQFLTTRVRIFRKQANMWWKIAPTITLTSSSGIYANANLSIMFSSHTDIINLEHPLDPHKFKLLAPNKTNPLSKDFMTIDTSKLPIDDKNQSDDISKSICYAKYISNNNQDIDNDYIDNDKYKNLRLRKREDITGVHSLSDLGYFPSKLNIMEQCKDRPDHLCLNMLDEEVPAYKISVQFPFTQNALVYENFDFIRITRIIVDGTVAGVINIKVDLVNMGFIGKDFIVFITKCPVTCGANMVRKKHLSPYRNSDVVFNLPLQIMHERSNSLFSCEVVVENAKEFSVAHRTFSVKPFSRCFCIWNCMCICMGAIAKGQGQDCHTLTPNRAKPAGFNDDYMDREAVFNWIALFQLVGLILLFFFLLGFLKGLFGICCKAIGRWKYNYLQPMNPFNEASFCKKLFINTIFFLVFPCVALCKCFTPTPDDLLESESTWERSFVQKEVLTDEDDYNDEDYNEMSNLLKVVNESDKKSSVERLRAAGDSLSPETIFDSYNDEEEERDTGFVLTALTESRESLKMLDGHCSEDSSNNDAKYVEAADLVKRLRASKIVYRTLNRPLGHIEIHDDQQYSIRGYFIPTVGPGYQFITHIPLRQHWRINTDANSLSPIIPPLTLLPKDFTRSYVNKRAVLDAGDLYEHPSIHAPCVNVLIQDIAMYDIGDYDVENIGGNDDSDFINDNNEQIVNNLLANELPPKVTSDESVHELK